MNQTYSTTLVVLLSLAFLLPAPLSAQEGNSENKQSLISLKIKGLPLGEALGKLEKKAQVHLAVSPELADKKVSLILKKVTWKKALQVVLKQSGARIEPREENLWIAVPNRYGSLQLKNAPLAPVFVHLAMRTDRSLIVPVERSLGRSKIDLKSVNLDTALSALAKVNGLYLHSHGSRVWTLSRRKGKRKGIGDFSSIRIFPKDFGRKPLYTVQFQKTPVAKVLQRFSNKAGFQFTNLEVDRKDNPRLHKLLAMEISGHYRRGRAGEILSYILALGRLSIDPIGPRVYQLKPLAPVYGRVLSVPLSQLIDTFSRLSGFDYILRGDFSMKVSGHFHRATWEEVLPALADLGRFKVTRKGSVYILHNRRKSRFGKWTKSPFSLKVDHSRLIAPLSISGKALVVVRHRGRGKSRKAGPISIKAVGIPLSEVAAKLAKKGKLNILVDKQGTPKITARLSQVSPKTFVRWLKHNHPELEITRPSPQVIHISRSRTLSLEKRNTSFNSILLTVAKMGTRSGYRKNKKWVRVNSPKLNFLTPPGDYPQVQLRLQNAPWKTGLEALATAVNLGVKKESKNFYRLYHLRKKTKTKGKSRSPRPHRNRLAGKVTSLEKKLARLQSSQRKMVRQMAKSTAQSQKKLVKSVKQSHQKLADLAKKRAEANRRDLKKLALATAKLHRQVRRIESLERALKRLRRENRNLAAALKKRSRQNKTGSPAKTPEKIDPQTAMAALRQKAQSQLNQLENTKDPRSVIEQWRPLENILLSAYFLHKKMGGGEKQLKALRGLYEDSLRKTLPTLAPNKRTEYETNNLRRSFKTNRLLFDDREENSTTLVETISKFRVSYRLRMKGIQFRRSVVRIHPFLVRYSVKVRLQGKIQNFLMFLNRMERLNPPTMVVNHLEITNRTNRATDMWDPVKNITLAFSIYYYRNVQESTEVLEARKDLSPNSLLAKLRAFLVKHSLESQRHLALRVVGQRRIQWSAQILALAKLLTNHRGWIHKMEIDVPKLGQKGRGTWKIDMYMKGLLETRVVDFRRDFRSHPQFSTIVDKTNFYGNLRPSLLRGVKLQDERDRENLRFTASITLK